MRPFTALFSIMALFTGTTAAIPQGHHLASPRSPHPQNLARDPTNSGLIPVDWDEDVEQVKKRHWSFFSGGDGAEDEGTPGSFWSGKGQGNTNGEEEEDVDVNVDNQTSTFGNGVQTSSTRESGGGGPSGSAPTGASRTGSGRVPEPSGSSFEDF